MKILSLMTRYNGLPAVLLGFFTAVLATGLFSYGFLPGISGFPSDPGLKWSAWSLGSGFAVALITFFLWRPQQLVFLDGICVNQHDHQQKAASIFSLAGILKRSDQMLVLWDSTWSDRLWCVFELSAFLKSKQASERVLVISPTFLGPCSIILFISVFIMMLPVIIVPMLGLYSASGQSVFLIPTCSAVLFIFVTGYFVVVALRRYFRSVETLKEKLRNINFDNTRCACCDQGHLCEGAPMLCDRRIVKKCVSIWFGSPEAFEDYVRSEVFQALVQELQENVFTRTWNLSVSIPILWAFLDFGASWALGEREEAAIGAWIEGIVLWFWCAPIFIDYCTFFARKYCKCGTSKFREVLQNLKVLLIGSVFFAVILTSYILLTAGGLRATGVFAGVWSTLGLCHVLYDAFKAW